MRLNLRHLFGVIEVGGNKVNAKIFKDLVGKKLTLATIVTRGEYENLDLKGAYKLGSLSEEEKAEKIKALEKAQARADKKAEKPKAKEAPKAKDAEENKEW